MRRHAFTSLLVITVLLQLPTPPARAITNGEIDSVHRNVGVMGVEYAPGEHYFLCSGTLIEPDVFLTAAHCVAHLSNYFSPEQVVVSFDANFFEASTFVRASEIYFDPGFLHYNEGDPRDLAVIILARPVTEWTDVSVDPPEQFPSPVVPAELPSAWVLDQMAGNGGLRGTSFVNVGYGAAASFKMGPPSLAFDGYRKDSTSPFQGLTLSLLKQLMNSEATGEGGVCFLDSGGPKFIPGTGMIVAVERGGDARCRAMSEAVRLDTPQSRAFLGNFVTMP